VCESREEAPSDPVTSRVQAQEKQLEAATVSILKQRDQGWLKP
jgi:hypothetical protein